MGLTERAWFRALAYVGMFFASWGLDLGLLLALYGKAFYPGLGTLIYSIFSPTVYALLLSLYFVKRRHYFSLLVPLLNFLIGLGLFVLTAIFLIDESG